MFRFLTLAFGLLLWSAQARTETLRPLFYVVEKDGQTAHLLGTIHHGVNHSELPAPIRAAAAAAASVVIETDLIRAQPLMAAAFPPGAPGSLRDQLNETEWTRFETALRALSAQTADPAAFMATIDRLHPVIANLYFGLASLPPTREPMDAILLRDALAAGKPLQYFEEPESQVELLAQTQNLAGLRRALNLAEGEMLAQVEALVRAYRAGDAERMLEVFRAQMSEEDYRLVLRDRNERWMEKFDAIFAHPGAEFIAVGAGHLIGPDSLVIALRARGYAVTPAR